MTIQNTDQNADMTTPLQIAGVNASDPNTQAPQAPQASLPNGIVPNAVTPAVRPAAPDAHVVQAGTFHRILSRIAGGDTVPVRDPSGNPVTEAQGNVVTRQLGKRSLGASILAGALSAMAAEAQHQPYRNGNGIWVNPSNEGTKQSLQENKLSSSLGQETRSLRRRNRATRHGRSNTGRMKQMSRCSLRCSNFIN